MRPNAPHGPMPRCAPRVRVGGCGRSIWGFRFRGRACARAAGEVAILSTRAGMCRTMKALASTPVFPHLQTVRAVCARAVSAIVSRHTRVGHERGPSAQSHPVYGLPTEHTYDSLTTHATMGRTLGLVHAVTRDSKESRRIAQPPATLRNSPRPHRHSRLLQLPSQRHTHSLRAPCARSTSFTDATPHPMLLTYASCHGGLVSPDSGHAPAVPSIFEEADELYYTAL